MEPKKEDKPVIVIGASVVLLAVLLGAFGAHALEKELTPDQLATFETGVRYQFYHGLALLFLGLYISINPAVRLLEVVILFCMGILLFSGSIYLIATRSITGIETGLLGPLTPIGGTLLIIGWTLLIWRILSDR